jgi:hypothetical protein
MPQCPVKPVPLHSSQAAATHVYSTQNTAPHFAVPPTFAAVTFSCLQPVKQQHVKPYAFPYRQPVRQQDLPSVHPYRQPVWPQQLAQSSESAHPYRLPLQQQPYSQSVVYPYVRPVPSQQPVQLQQQHLQHFRRGGLPVLAQTRPVSCSAVAATADASNAPSINDAAMMTDDGGSDESLCGETNSCSALHVPLWHSREAERKLTPPCRPPAGGGSSDGIACAGSHGLSSPPQTLGSKVLQQAGPPVYRPVPVRPNTLLRPLQSEKAVLRTSLAPKFAPVKGEAIVRVPPPADARALCSPALKRQRVDEGAHRASPVVPLGQCCGSSTAAAVGLCEDSNASSRKSRFRDTARSLFRSAAQAPRNHGLMKKPPPFSDALPQALVIAAAAAAEHNTAVPASLPTAIDATTAPVASAAAVATPSSDTDPVLPRRRSNTDAAIEHASSDNVGWLGSLQLLFGEATGEVTAGSTICLAVDGAASARHFRVPDVVPWLPSTSYGMDDLWDLHRSPGRWPTSASTALAPSAAGVKTLKNQL